MEQVITNNDFITINRQGVFVGGKQTKKYHGKQIENLEQIKKVFSVPGIENIIEIRVMQSETKGMVFQFGNPVPSENGSCVWLQVVSEYGASPWVYRLNTGIDNNAAPLCAFQCVWTLCQYQRWRDYMLNATKNNNRVHGMVKMERTR